MLPFGFLILQWKTLEVSGQKKIDQLQYQLKSWDARSDMMPNIVRTVARCTIINQYLDFCKRKISVP